MSSGVDFFDIVDYLGEVVVMFLRLAPQPWRWRWTPMVYHLEMYGLRSVPIIMLDQLSGRRDRHAAGHLPTRQIRRRGLRGQSGRRPGLARTRRAHDLDHDRRAHRIVDHRRNRLDEDARRDRRSEGDGARPAGSAHHSAAGGARDRSARFDVSRGSRSDGRRSLSQLDLCRPNARRLSRSPSERHLGSDVSWSASSRRRSWLW